MFGALAWRLRQERRQIGNAAAVGAFAGMLSWIFTAAVPGTLLGGMLYMPLSQGLLVGLAAWLFFRGPLVDARVLPVAVAAAWIGDMANLILHAFVRVGIPFVKMPGASLRTISIVSDAVCIHLAILLVIGLREKQAGSPAGPAEARPAG
jgi:hypothetical protein